LHDLIFSAFRKKFGDIVLEVKLFPMIHELWVTVVVKKKSKEMEIMARQIEQEFLEDLGRHIAIFIKKRRWKLRLSGWRNLFRGKTVGSEAS